MCAVQSNNKHNNIYVSMNTLLLSTVLYPQVMYYRDARDVYTDLSTKLGSKKGDLSPEDYRQTMKQKLAEIRALSITLDD